MQLFTQHLTVVPSTKGWRHQCGGRSWLFHLQLGGKCTAGPSYWHYYSAAMPLFNSSSLAPAIPSLHSCRKHPSISGFTVSSKISENLIQRIVNPVQILILIFPPGFQRDYRSYCLPLAPRNTPWGSSDLDIRKNILDPSAMSTRWSTRP
jgi:hypothetical protein